MAQFIETGLDIPNDLLEAQHDGRLIFFCGAGISCNLNLDNFEWLVGQVMQKLALNSTAACEEKLGINEQDRKTIIEEHPDYLLNLIGENKGYESLKGAIIDALEINGLSDRPNYNTHERVSEKGYSYQKSYYQLQLNYDL